MIEVKVTDSLNFEKAMRIFKKACQKDGFMMELKERQYYTKPSEKKRHKKKR
jgi:small subunit ribosomal protein S21